ncbi:unnamed protein product [Rhizoctonia solani]|uniref:Protein kinase domain-containing protein n=1 Tax=Rhizoctonia solani TaxID=456999 RepID=A0A8H3H7R2_9AGAM|nr:unnamed protein product [Rhizoctonia solani]
MSSRNRRDQGSSSRRGNISSNKSSDEILDQLLKHGNKDITQELILKECGQYPVSNGGAGNVYRGKIRGDRPVAMKSLRILAGTDDDEAEGRKQIARAAHEIYVWSKCNHPNVLELIGIAQYQSQIVMVSPWMANGNLNYFLRRSRDSVDVYNVCAQVADGVAYLHSEGTVHGDIKGDNILVSDEHIPKLTDFGTSSLSAYTLQFTSSAIDGRGYTICYTPPEILNEESKATIKGDVYSLGMVRYPNIASRLIQVKLTFTRLYWVTDKKHPLRPEQGMPDNKKHADILWELLTSCWAYGPDSRPDASEVANKLRKIQHTIDSKMSVRQILRCLNLHGCEDVTKTLHDPNPRPQGNLSNSSTCYDIFRDGKLAFRCPSLDQPPEECRQQPDLAYELYIWSQCKHPSILKLFGATEFRGNLAMVSNWRGRGTLDSYVTRNDVDRCEMCKQLVGAVSYLHSKNIAHGDLKMANILVSMLLASNTLQCKLFGFSYARVYQHDQLKFSGLRPRVSPPPAWLAPENKGSDKKPKATYEADVYALGKTILEILLRGRPGYKNFGPTPNALRIPKRPEQYLPPGNEQADRLWSVLKLCWSRNPKDRPRASRIKNVMRTITDEGLWGQVSESGEDAPTESETGEDASNEDGGGGGESD